ncbi:MAG: FAD-binding oxidoreductase [Aureispira sp.]|nr:FAD-binding oxidoreductase [Aureispira sp.]
MENNTWWKWGNPKESQHLSEYPKLIAYLEEVWGCKIKDDFKIPSNFDVPTTTFLAEDFSNTFPKLSKNQFSNSKTDRLRYAIARSYHDIIKVFKNQILSYPDFVVYPESEDDIVHILEQANLKNIKIITYSGGSNVTGATEVEKNDQLTLVLNMTRLNNLVEIDGDSLTATFQAGIYGPELEKILNKKGFTLGHFPQSFEYSTLGGWVATRSAGQESGLYGKIEDMVLGLEVITPTGTIKHIDFPRHASGIDFYHLFVGSEGTLGVISKAKMRISKLPKDYIWTVALFKDFESGSNAIKDMIQAGIHASITRLSDATETKFLSLMSNSVKSGFKAQIEKLMKARLKRKGYTNPCILMMRFAIKNETDRYAPVIAKSICKKNGSTSLPANVSSTWEEKRFALPYLRDTMVEHRLLIDTFETITYWSNIKNLYDTVHRSLKSNSDFFAKKGLLFCHISHAYETGASLYFTMLIQQEKGQELEQWKRYKKIVSDTLIEAGGAISHHHGVGKDHQKWYLQKLSPESQELLKVIKKHLDPNNILNPNKLYDS